MHKACLFTQNDLRPAFEIGQLKCRSYISEGKIAWLSVYMMLQDKVAECRCTYLDSS